MGDWETGGVIPLLLCSSIAFFPVVLPSRNSKEYNLTEAESPGKRDRRGSQKDSGDPDPVGIYEPF